LPDLRGIGEEPLEQALVEQADFLRLRKLVPDPHCLARAAGTEKKERLRWLQKSTIDVIRLHRCHNIAFLDIYQGKTAPRTYPYFHGSKPKARLKTHAKLPWPVRPGNSSEPDRRRERGEALERWGPGK
jgi:hypothetical protein